MNDDIKKFIDLTNLYTEVEVRKTENLEEGFLDWIKDKLNPDEDPEEVIKDLDPIVVQQLDDVVDDNDLEPGNGTNVEPRPTENDEGDPYDIINARQQVKAGEVGARARLDRGLAELKSDQEAWDKENPGAAGSTGPTTRPNNRPAAGEPNVSRRSNAGPEVQTDVVQPKTPEVDDESPTIPSGKQTFSAADPQAQWEELKSNGNEDDIKDFVEELPAEQKRALGIDPLAPAGQVAREIVAGDATNTTGTDTPKITAEIQVELEKRGLDKGMIGEPLTPEDIAALEQPVPAANTSGSPTPMPGPGGAGTATPSANTSGSPTPMPGPGGAGTATPAATTAEPAASNGSLLGRKLDTTTPNLMKAYNDGGKQEMPAIKNMQTALSRLGFDPNGLDGKYGPGTFKAVQEFQKANSLSVDGQAGPSTMAAIKKALDDNSPLMVTPADSAQAAEPTLQTASKDNNMNKNKINEASMNISMNGNDASEVADLVKLLQNAGMPQASPVSDIPMPMPKALPTPHDHDSHDNMKSMMTLMSEPDDAPCGEDCGCDSCATEDTSEYDAVVSEWDNSPEEEYSDISAVLPDGDDLHKSKKPYPAVDGGDNAMALESIKEALWAALQEKATTEGRGRGKKMKLKASRGNEDIKTTEGSRGKKSRGKKSRG